jgi:hypothetical protein
MTPEARLDRLERIVMLFVKAGLRQRRASREQDNKINHLIDHQKRNEETLDKLIDLQLHSEERVADQNGRIDNLIKLQKHNEVRFARLVEVQTNNDRRLEVLIELVKDARKGKSRSRTDSR